MGRPAGSPNKDKPLRDALRMEALAIEAGEECVAPKGSLRYLARQLLLRACDDTASFREVADRLDGKPAQAIENGEDGAFEVIQRIERIITNPANPDS